jgi:hypothetical protein
MQSHGEGERFGEGAGSETLEGSQANVRGDDRHGHVRVNFLVPKVLTWHSFDVRGTDVYLFLYIDLNNRVVVVDVLGSARFFLMLGEICV